MSIYHGNKYIVNENTEEVQVCIVNAMPPDEINSTNTVLIENSVVFDGAYPNAVIQSAAGCNIDLNKKEEGFSKEVDLSFNPIAYTYKDTLAILDVQEKSKKGGVEEMAKRKTEEEVIPTFEEEVVETAETPAEETAPQAVEEQAQEEGKVEPEAEETVEATETPVEAEPETQASDDTVILEQEEIKSVTGKVLTREQVIAMLDEANKYRTEVIESALKSGVRAFGNDFKSEIFKKTFDGLSISEIKEMSNAWEKQVEEIFSTQRVSVEPEKKKKEEGFAIKVSAEHLKTAGY